MSDTEIITAISGRVKNQFTYTMNNGKCIELNLNSIDNFYYGAIRDYGDQEKMEILNLICRLDSLEKLNLYKNNLKKIPGSIANLTNLVELNLGSNHLGLIPIELRGLRKLKMLHLGNNDIEEIPDWFSAFCQLEYLALHKNTSLKNIDALEGQKSLKNLNLYFLSVGKIPRFIYKLDALSTLTLFNISSISDEIAQLKNLEYFTNCGSPKLNYLPDGFTQLKKLKMARLYQNSLKELPSEFGLLKNLEQLSLYQNLLGSLPCSMQNLTLLKKLNIGWNNFKEIPPWILDLNSLEWLAVFENPLPSRIDSNNSRIKIEFNWPYSTMKA